MFEDRASDYISAWGQMKAARATWEYTRREICDRIDPFQAPFYDCDRDEGEKRTYEIYDSAGPAALDRFCAIMESVLTPGGGAPWHILRPEGYDGIDLDPGSETARWLEDANKRLWRDRYAAKAGFASAMAHVYRSLGSIGTACVYVDSAPGVPLRYRAIPMSEVCIGTNSQGQVDQVFRRFQLEARQAVKQFEKDKLSQKVRDLAKTSPTEKIWFLHCVFPNPDVTWGKIGPAGMAWSSRYVCEYDQEIVRKSGYRTMPYLVTRFNVAAGEVYGRAPADIAIPEIKMLNEMMKSRVRAVRRELDPPWLTAEDAVMTPLRTTPGAINPGGLDSQGRELVKPMLPTGVRFEIDAAMTEQTRGVVNDYFFITLFQVLVDQPNMTATEALLRAQEKAQLLAPPTTRQQNELLGPMIERDMDLMYEARRLPPFPEELVLNGGNYDIEYSSPYANAMKAADANAVMQVYGALLPLAQLKPEILDNFDDDANARIVAEGFNMPSRGIASEEMRDAKRQQRAQQQALAAATQAAQPVTGAIKNLADVAAMGTA